MKRLFLLLAASLSLATPALAANCGVDTPVSGQAYCEKGFVSGDGNLFALGNAVTADDNDTNDVCTAVGIPYACCTGPNTGTCTLNSACVGPGNPVSCCFGPGTGSCAIPGLDAGKCRIVDTDASAAEVWKILCDGVQLTIADLLVTTALDTQAELEALLTDVTNVITDNEAAADLACASPPCVAATELSQHAGTDVSADLEEETHAAEHLENAADELNVEALGSTCTNAQVIGGDGTGGAECQADVDTNAGTICSGTNTYLDGEGACDTLDTLPIDALADHGNICAGSEAVRRNSGDTANECFAPGDVSLAGTQTLTNKTIDGGDSGAGTTRPAGSNIIGLRSHNTDCTTLTDGKAREVCCNEDDFLCFVCVPTAGDCSGTEWKAITQTVQEGGSPIGNCHTTNFSSLFDVSESANVCSVALGSTVVVTSNGLINDADLPAEVPLTDEANNFTASQGFRGNLLCEQSGGTDIVECSASGNYARYFGAYSNDADLATKAKVSLRYVQTLAWVGTASNALTFDTPGWWGLSAAKRATIPEFVSQPMIRACTLQNLTVYMGRFGAWPSGASIVFTIYKASAAQSMTVTATNSGTWTAAGPISLVAGDLISLHSDCTGTCTDTGTSLTFTASAECVSG